MRFLLVLALLFHPPLQAVEKGVLNLSTWADEMSDKVIDQFQEESGIKVNFSTYDSNEFLYAKMKGSNRALYDVVCPSGYYIRRMAREGMIEKIDFTKLDNIKNIFPTFRNSDFDPKGEYNVPWVWGATGIFVNRKYYPNDVIEKWSDLWSDRYRDSLLMLNDPRELFTIALITLGYSPNDETIEHIEEAYRKLVKLLPNIRLYNSSSVAALIIDEDATIGMVWSGNAYKAMRENPSIEFIYPKDGFAMWVDAFTIPKEPPHRENSYRFLNFILRPEIAAEVVEETFYATANREALSLLPKELAESKVIFPDEKTMERGTFQSDINNEALEALTRYWQLLKLQ